MTLYFRVVPTKFGIRDAEIEHRKPAGAVDDGGDNAAVDKAMLLG